MITHSHRCRLKAPGRNGLVLGYGERSEPPRKCDARAQIETIAPNLPYQGRTPEWSKLLEAWSVLYCLTWAYSFVVAGGYVHISLH